MIFQARILMVVAETSSSGIFQTPDRTHLYASRIGGCSLPLAITREDVMIPIPGISMRNKNYVHTDTAHET